MSKTGPPVLPPGKTHTVQVQFVNDDGVTVTLDAALPLVMTVGDFKPPVIDSSTELDTQWISDWLTETGLLAATGADPAELLERCKTVWTSTHFLCPRLSITDPRFKAFCLYLMFVAVATKLPEVDKMKGRGGGASQKMIGILGKVVGDLLSNKYEKLEDLPELPEKAAPLVKALHVISVISKRDIPCWTEEVKWLVDSMSKALGAAPLLENDFLDQSPETFKYLKRYAGAEPMIELSAMANTVTLPESMRSSLLVQQIMNKACSMAATTLDIKMMKISLELGNRISVLTLWKRKGCTVEEAFKKAVADLEQDAFEFRLLCLNIRAMNKKNSRLDRFLKHVEEFLDGNTMRPMDKELEQYEKNKELVKEKVAEVNAEP